MTFQNGIENYMFQIDECGRMWILDTGRYGDNLVCPPQILAFDMKTVSYNVLV